MIAIVDEPEENAVVHRHGFAVSGWFVPEEGRTVVAVAVVADGETLGVTRQLFARPDVDSNLSLPPGGGAGFAVDCVVPAIARERPTLRVSVETIDDAGEHQQFGTRSVQLSNVDYREAVHGRVFQPRFDAVVTREQIYATGPPSPVAYDRCTELIFRHLDPAARTLDIGCGIGAYGYAFRDAGRPWTGCEVEPEFVATARAAGLDVKLSEPGRLPFPDASFDAALAIEVIEHVDDLPAFVAEMHRVAPRLALVSVPNFELVPITATFYTVPWHMLEPDHKNFFTHRSLAATLRAGYEHVEVREYGPIPLRTADGLTMNNHLFAIAWNDR